MLSNTTLRGLGYLHIHVLFYNWIKLADYLSMYSSLISLPHRGQTWFEIIKLPTFDLDEVGPVND